LLRVSSLVRPQPKAADPTTRMEKGRSEQGRGSWSERGRGAIPRSGPAPSRNMGWMM
jgi:hypothetical protein